jgi:hypothetical protein
MNGIETNFNKSVTVQRLSVKTSHIGDEKYANHLTAVACHIQPLDESITEDLSGSFGKDYLMFAYVQDIVEGDQVVDGSDKYKVVGVESYEFLGQNRHMELRIRKYND